MEAWNGSASPEEEGRVLVEQLGGRWTSRGALCRCPAHDDHSPSLSVRAGRTRLLLHCFAGCSAEQVLNALGKLRLITPGAGAPAHSRRTSLEKPQSAAALLIWRASRSLHGTAAEQYLAGRGLRTRSPELRFNLRTPCGRAPLTRYCPALIAAVRDDSGLTGIHRTFLHPAAPGDALQKRGLGRFGGGAVRLARAGAVLGLAEGIETALSTMSLFDVPCWATLGTERFARVALPSGTERLLLFLDHDAGGRRAEALARGAFGERMPIISHYPPGAGDDWNDVLRKSSAVGKAGLGLDDTTAAPPVKR